jgi:hypothetical protein
MTIETLCFFFGTDDQVAMHTDPRQTYDGTNGPVEAGFGEMADILF